MKNKTKTIIISSIIILGIISIFLSPTIENSLLLRIPDDSIGAHDKVTIILTKHNQSPIDVIYMTLINHFVPNALFGTVSYSEVSFNKITNFGATFIGIQIQSQSVTTYSANWMALSQDNTAPSYTDSSCTNEATLFGLTRGQGIYSVSTPASSGSFVMKLITTWTATGTYNNINKFCLWNSRINTDSTLFSTALLTSTVNMVNGDTLQITYQTTITY